VVFFYIAFEFNLRTCKQKQSLLVIKSIIPFVIITGIKTFMALLKDPYISRSIKTSDEYSISILASGVGGYEFIYFIVFITIILFALLLNAKKLNSLTSIFQIIMLMFFSWIVILSNYFTALTTMLIAGFQYFITWLFKKKRFILIFCSIILVCLFLLFRNVIIHTLIELVSSFIGKGENFKRLMIIKESLASNTQFNLSDERFRVLRLSFDAFVNNPFWGIVTKPIQIINGRPQGFGQHSFILDTFALYGFLPGATLLYIIIQPFLKRIKTKVEPNNSVWLMLTSMLIILVFNTATPSIGLALFFIYPVVYDIIKIKKDEENNNEFV